MTTTRLPSIVPKITLGSSGRNPAPLPVWGYRIHAWLVTTVAVWSMAVVNAADEATAKPDPPEKQPSSLHKRANERLEIDGTPALPQKEDTLDRVAKGMRLASDRLDGGQTDEQTTKIQQQVIRDLEEIIKQLQSPPNGGGGGGGGGGSGSGGGGGGGDSSASGGSSRKKKSGHRGGTRLPSEGTPDQPSRNGDAEQGGKERKDAEGSQERHDAERQMRAEAARKKKLEMDVWGHLPPHLREQLLNTYGERMLPKYENLVKKFYESLSEHKQTTPRR